MNSHAHRDWNELHRVENPAIDLLQSLGYTYVAPEALEAERESLKEGVLTGRLRAALKKLNPWLSDDNLSKAVRAVSSVQSTSLIEASEKLHTTLTRGVSLEQDLGGGKKGQSVRFIDFENPRRNELIVTRQFRLQGSRKQIVPDIILFVNGIPLVVIEAKSPTLGEKWKQEALDQMLRYQEIGAEYRELGMPKLFETVQIIVATCEQAAVYGTTTTPARFYAEWKTAWPRTEAELERELGHAPTPQEILFYGLLSPEALLDVVRNFVVFERDPDTGRILRKLCRYQQFAAVNKAIERARKAKRPSDRGGVVWHTQGSGKSLSMLWLALKLRRDPTHENPMLVIVTDRVDLDQQIADTFVACGYPNPTRAESVKDLQHLLSGPGGITVLTTVQKFQELSPCTGSQGQACRSRGVPGALRGQKPLRDDRKSAMTPKTDELPRLQTRHAAALRFFVRVKDKRDLNACVMALAAEDVRAEFNDAFRKFSQSLDLLLPDPAALPYVSDARWLGKIRAAASARFRDNTLDISDCGEKVRQLIEEAIAAEGIQILVQRVSLFTPEFEEKLQNLKSDEAKASEMEHAIKDEIHVKLDEDPVFYASLASERGADPRVVTRWLLTTPALLAFLPASARRAAHWQTVSRPRRGEWALRGVPR